MQQRQPRLGDIVDDYCPRERRITNHAVVAMVGDDIKQTRCTTCDADHEYKHAKVPPQRRKKEEGGVLYQHVLAGMPRKPPGAAAAPPDADSAPGAPVSHEPEPEREREGDVEQASSLAAPDESVHRPLIRATLPRLTDDPPQRREPEFTMRSPQHTRPGKFGKGGYRGSRPGGGHGFGGNGGTNGNRAPGSKRQGAGHRSGNFAGGGRSGQPHGNRQGRPGGHGQGPSHGPGHGHGRGPGRGGKKSPR